MKHALAIVVALMASAVALAQDPPRRPPGFPPMGGQKPKVEEIAAKDVTITTDDGVALAGTFWGVKDSGGAGAVLLHMYGSDRTAWAPLVKHLRARGIAVLAIDLRGHGGSTKQGKTDLAPRVQKRDPKLFAEMHRDAFAAIAWIAKDGKCDPKRIALVGASVGCSVAIDTTRRHPESVAAVACMSPGASYLGLDSVTHLETFPAKTPLLLLVHSAELEAGAQKIVDARPASRLVTYDDAPPADKAKDRAWAHGTKMFGTLPLVEQTVASFAAAKTGSKTDTVVLDGIVGDDDGGDPWADATDVAMPKSGVSARAFRVGRRVVFSGSAPADTGGLRFEVESGSLDPNELGMVGPPQVVAVDAKTGLCAWSFGGMGSIPDMPGMDASNLFGKTRPVLRVVRTGETMTFEGEWFVPAMGDETTNRVRLVITFDREVHPRPANGAMDANPQFARELTSR